MTMHDHVVLQPPHDGDPIIIPFSDAEFVIGRGNLTFPQGVAVEKCSRKQAAISAKTSEDGTPDVKIACLGLNPISFVRCQAVNFDATLRKSLHHLKKGEDIKLSDGDAFFPGGVDLLLTVSVRRGRTSETSGTSNSSDLVEASFRGVRQSGGRDAAVEVCSPTTNVHASGVQLPSDAGQGVEAEKEGHSCEEDRVIPTIREPSFACVGGQEGGAANCSRPVEEEDRLEEINDQSNIVMEGNPDVEERGRREYQIGNDGEPSVAGGSCQPAQSSCLKGVVASLTGYIGPEKDHLVHLIKQMGGVHTGELSVRNTHLVCWHHRGLKFDFAMRTRGIHIVNHEWLEDSFNAHTKMPESLYSISGEDAKDCSCLSDDSSAKEELSVSHTAFRERDASSAQGKPVPSDMEHRETDEGIACKEVDASASTWEVHTCAHLGSKHKDVSTSLSGHIRTSFTGGRMDTRGSSMEKGVSSSLPGKSWLDQVESRIDAAREARAQKSRCSEKTSFSRGLPACILKKGQQHHGRRGGGVTLGLHKMNMVKERDAMDYDDELKEGMWQRKNHLLREENDSMRSAGQNCSSRRHGKSPVTGISTSREAGKTGSKGFKGSSSHCKESSAPEYLQISSDDDDSSVVRSRNQGGCFKVPNRVHREGGGRSASCSGTHSEGGSSRGGDVGGLYDTVSCRISERLFAPIENTLDQELRSGASTDTCKTENEARPHCRPLRRLRKVSEKKEAQWRKLKGPYNPPREWCQDDFSYRHIKGTADQKQERGGSAEFPRVLVSKCLESSDDDIEDDDDDDEKLLMPHVRINGNHLSSSKLFVRTAAHVPSPVSGCVAGPATLRVEDRVGVSSGCDQPGAAEWLKSSLLDGSRGPGKGFQSECHNPSVARSNTEEASIAESARKNKEPAFPASDRGYSSGTPRAAAMAAQNVQPGITDKGGSEGQTAVGSDRDGGFVTTKVFANGCMMPACSSNNLAGPPCKAGLCGTLQGNDAGTTTRGSPLGLDVVDDKCPRADTKCSLPANPTRGADQRDSLGIRLDVRSSECEGTVENRSRLPTSASGRVSPGREAQVFGPDSSSHRNALGRSHWGGLDPHAPTSSPDRSPQAAPHCQVFGPDSASHRNALGGIHCGGLHHHGLDPHAPTSSPDRSLQAAPHCLHIGGRVDSEHRFAERKRSFQKPHQSSVAMNCAGTSSPPTDAGFLQGTSCNEDMHTTVNDLCTERKRWVCDEHQRVSHHVADGDNLNAMPDAVRAEDRSPPLASKQPQKEEAHKRSSDGRGITETSHCFPYRDRVMSGPDTLADEQMSQLGNCKRLGQEDAEKSSYFVPPRAASHCLPEGVSESSIPAAVLVECGVQPITDSEQGGQQEPVVSSSVVQRPNASTAPSTSGHVNRNAGTPGRISGGHNDLQRGLYSYFTAVKRGSSCNDFAQTQCTEAMSTDQAVCECWATESGANKTVTSPDAGSNQSGGANAVTSPGAGSPVSPSGGYQCIICLSSPNEVTDKGILACSHAFCFMCICKWAETLERPFCPVCRAEFDTITKKRLQSEEGTVTAAPKRQKTHTENLVEQVCNICNQGDQDALLLLCDRCDQGAAHTFCLDPPLPAVPPGEWICDRCMQWGSLRPDGLGPYMQAAQGGRRVMRTRRGRAARNASYTDVFRGTQRRAGGQNGTSLTTPQPVGGIDAGFAKTMLQSSGPSSSSGGGHTSGTSTSNRTGRQVARNGMLSTRFGSLESYWHRTLGGHQGQRTGAAEEECEPEQTERSNLV
ncbi:hypothetical protein CBR_g45172 [Chara braunii]|uniref:Uncharacterized protein n=1 Tax=Chara braunii TaxID=69332 RepID=A0A388K367_CHABU|nr:hypothetical protein CBR_g45172 [Chara braunii]|eukprot:GBG64476.1 hypothetical protein CBR_g45172 [Chara braunii]